MFGIKKEDSVVTLTKPQLFSIYDKEVIINDQDYNRVRDILARKSDGKTFKDRKVHVNAINVIFAGLVLFCLGVVFAIISEEIYDNCSLTNGVLSITLNKINTWMNEYVTGTPKCVTYGILGVLCGFVIPIVDNILNIDKRQIKNNDFNSILKCLNAMLGICLGIRNIEWSSSLQASVAWCLLNIILWLFLDGTESIALVGIVISLTSCVISFQQLFDVTEIIYIVDFYFFSFLVFGKMGRYLFRSYYN
ncbi:hypothetical protein KAFR_0F00540 [Kazachstania africana CBS 2517]|uniref:Uncharacterized protein n=1 Tax=Kazachstania africana (strain ATCC 22294 / BCRC 22015 / CBS 2517 / CECT 1963 / NBRC 1671 / NRRL Y-8276) TaxID=1071382 RepID=H2AWA1_KAZAF|nr:hypothetical protein KAFR_0F00540 [Kazachstania africana CBS 2517]CCF58651.1 hypothetical protein KAFR_0F00540 [Kazachstania africana CBS 2517]